MSEWNLDMCPDDAAQENHIPALMTGARMVMRASKGVLKYIAVADAP